MKESERKHATTLVKKKQNKLKKKHNNMQLSYKFMPYEELIEYSMENCELCSSIFHNKLDKYIHNAKHMKITLRKAFQVNFFQGNARTTYVNTFNKHKVETFHSNVEVQSQYRPSNCIIIGSNSNHSNLKMDADENDIKLSLKMDTNDCTIPDETSHRSTLKSALLKDLCLKTPVVACDDIIPLILNKGQIKDSQVMKGPVKIELKDMFSKKLVVNCNNDIVTKVVSSVSNMNKSSKDTVNDTVEVFSPVISKVVTIKEKEIISQTKNIMKYSNEEIVISDSDNEDLSMCDDNIKAFSNRIDTDQVTLTKLTFNDLHALNESVKKEIADIDSVPEIDSDGNDSNEETKDVAINVLKVDSNYINCYDDIKKGVTINIPDDDSEYSNDYKVDNDDSEYSNDYKGDNGDFCNDFDFKMDINDDFVNQETVNESLKEFIKSEMEQMPFQGLDNFFESDAGFSESLRSKIIFEDDPDDLLFDNDLMKIPDTNNCTIADINKCMIPDKNKCSIVDTKPKVKLAEVPEVHYDSVHYSDLKVEESVRCKYCSKQFPSMYDLCTHEMTHMKFRTGPWATPICPICNIYIAGNYRVLTSHILQEHPHKHIRKQVKHKCKECRLTYYNYAKHSMHYHKKRLCYICKENFWDKVKFDNHMSDHSQGKTVPLSTMPKEATSNIIPNIRLLNKRKDYHLRLCEVCAMFQRFTKFYRYVCVGSLCEVGKTFQCDKCNKYFFEVKKFARHPINANGYRKVHKWKTTQETKMDRLKNIWKKLKGMNK